MNLCRKRKLLTRTLINTVSFGWKQPHYYFSVNTNRLALTLVTDPWATRNVMSWIILDLWKRRYFHRAISQRFLTHIVSSFFYYRNYLLTWRGKSSNSKSSLLVTPNCSLEKYCPLGPTLFKLLGKARQRVWQPFMWHWLFGRRSAFQESGRFGLEPKNGC